MDHRPRSRVFSGPSVIEPEEIMFDPEKDKIGEGCFGSVYRGECRAFHVAVKVPKKQKLSKRAAEAFRKEVQLMSKIYHPNVCLFMGASTEPGRIRIVTELMKGDVEGLIRGKARTHPLSLRLKWAKDAAQGMAWLHGNNPPIIHRDLKVGNMLYDENMKIKVCDFGLSQFAETDMYDREPKGTPLYMAPEVMMKEEITMKVDVYSFGIILWEMLTGREAFEHHSNYDTFVDCVCNKGERPSIPADCPTSLKVLMTMCWDDSPDRRPTFPEIVSHLDKLIEEMTLLESSQEIDHRVHDHQGRLFWKKYFLDKKIVGWSEFSSAFFQFLELELPEDPSDRPLGCQTTAEDLRHASFQKLSEFATTSETAAKMVQAEVARRQNPDSQMSYQSSAYGAYTADTGMTISPDLRRLLCLKAVMTNDGDTVEIDTFGKVLGWFGPFEHPSPKNGGFISRVVDLLNESWFHGMISAKESENILKVQPRGTFLVRFSNSRPNAYCLSKVSSQRVIKHIIVPYEPGIGFRLENQVFASMMELINQQSKKYYLKFAAPGSKFRWIFEDIVADVGLYAKESQEEIKQNELNFEISASAGFHMPISRK